MKKLKMKKPKLVQKLINSECTIPTSYHHLKILKNIILIFSHAFLSCIMNGILADQTKFLLKFFSRFAKKEKKPKNDFV